MKVKRFITGPIFVNTYVVYDEDSADAIIIDAGGSAEEIVEFVKENKLQVKGIYNTHGHFDHVMGAKAIQDNLQVGFYLNKNDLKASQTTIYRYLDNLVKEGIIKKNYSEEKSSSCYQYVGKRCKEHYHLKCNNCGEIIHLDSEIFSSIEKKIIDRYGFKIDNIKTILYGTCNKCNMNNKSK